MLVSQMSESKLIMFSYSGSGPSGHAVGIMGGVNPVSPKFHSLWMLVWSDIVFSSQFFFIQHFVFLT